MRKLKQIIDDFEAGRDKSHVAEAVYTAYHAGLSEGQERAESKIRNRLGTMPAEHFRNVADRAVNHVLADNYQARVAPVSPYFSDALEFDYRLETDSSPLIIADELEGRGMEDAAAYLRDKYRGASRVD